MKKLRTVLTVAAVSVSMVAAFAFSKVKPDPCMSVTLYYKNGSGVFVQVPAQDGTCGAQSTACKYYNAGTVGNPNYQPCDIGTYGRAPFTPNP